MTAICSGMSDEIVVKMAENATMGYDAGFDAIKLQEISSFASMPCPY